MTMDTLLRLMLPIWLLTLAAFGQPSPLSASASSSVWMIFIYDGQNHASIGYDLSPPSGSHYDSAAMLTPNGTGDNTWRTENVFLKSAQFLAAKTAPTAGQKVYRVYGGDSLAGGASWTPVNPANVPNFRNVGGLPSGGASGANNSGRFVIEGTIQDPSAVVRVRNALSLDGNTGGLPEYIIPNWQQSGAIRVNRVSGVNPEF